MKILSKQFKTIVDLVRATTRSKVSHVLDTSSERHKAALKNYSLCTSQRRIGEFELLWSVKPEAAQPKAPR